MADGYGAGLFDENGPKNFATAVGGISTKLTQVTSDFTAFGTSASKQLTSVTAAIDALLGKLSQVSSQLSNLSTTTGGPGGGGAQAAANTPAPQQGGPQQPSQWAKDAAPQPSSGPALNTASPQSGMPQGTASQGGWWSRAWGWVTAGTALQANAQYGGSQPQGGGSGMQLGSASMGQRAVQSMIPAAVGSAGSAAAGLTATAVQGATIGGMLAPGFGGTAQQYYRIPSGVLSATPQGYAQANYLGVTQGGVSGPGTAGWNTYQSSLNQMMTLDPGLQRQQAGATWVNQLQNPQNLNQALAFGMKLSGPNGQPLGAQQQIQTVFKTLQSQAAVPLSKQNISDWLTRPGSPWAAKLQTEVGWAPGSEMYNQFVQYAATQVGLNAQGKTMPGNLGTQAGATQAGLNTPAYAQLQRDTASSRLASQAEPDLAEASRTLNEAATKLLNLAQGPAGFLGGIGGGGPVGGMVGGAANLGLTAGGLWLGSKAVKKMGGSVIARGASLFGRNAASTAEGAVAKRAGGGLLSRVGGLFGRGAAGAAEVGGEDAAATAGVEAAGLGLDATGIGLPAGLAIGAAGLIAGPAIGSAVSHVGHWLGGLFGGGSAGAATPKTTTTPGDPHGSLADLLSTKPPTNSLLATLTQPVTRGANTLAASLVYGSGGANTTTAQGGGTVSGTASGTSGGGSAGWAYQGSMVGAADLSGAFRSTSSSNGSSGSGSSGGAGSSAPATGSSGTGSKKAWAQLLLQDVGAPQTANNVSNIGIWMTNEEPTSNWNDRNNPLNASVGTGSSDGTGSYANLTDAAKFTAGMIHQSNMSGILQALMANANPDTFAAAVMASPWASSHYSSRGGAQGFVSAGPGFARGSQQIARTQLALLHRGEAVIPAADNYSAPYNKNGAASTGGGAVHLNFKSGSIVLQVPPSSTQQDMENLANQFVAAISKPQIIAGVRSS